MSLPERGAGSLAISDTDAVLADIRVLDISDTTLAALRAGGAEIVHVAPAYRTVTAFVQPNQLMALAALSAVENIHEELQPRVGHSEQTTRSSRPIAQIDCPSATTSEGDTQLKADAARSAFDIDGSGITVGVLSNSYNKDSSAPTTAETDIASGDLPGAANPCNRLTPINVIAESQNQDPSRNTDEGRAMLQIVHDLAPGANLAFATADGGIFTFADNIRSLRNTAGASVIVDDIEYLEEPFYQDGPVNLAIQNVVNSGALYVTAAGNSNVRSADNTPLDAFSSYETFYRPIACPVLTLPNGRSGLPGKDCHNFNPGGEDNTYGITLAPGGDILMLFQWAEPWFGVTADMDIYLVDESGQILSRSDNLNIGPSGSQQPFEAFSYTNNRGAPQVVQVVIARASGNLAPLIKTVLERSVGVTMTEYDSTNSTDSFGPTVVGHAEESLALTVGAVPYNDATTPESFSSRGPAVIYFGPTVNTTPASPLPQADVRTKPELAATDGGRTTFFGEFTDAYRFFGTSAAAPHAAAIGALLQQRASQRGVPLYPTFAKSILQRTASPIPNGSSQANGAGLINAIGALYEQERLQVKSVLLPVVRK